MLYGSLLAARYPIGRRFSTFYIGAFCGILFPADPHRWCTLYLANQSPFYEMSFCTPILVKRTLCDPFSFHPELSLLVETKIYRSSSDAMYWSWRVSLGRLDH